MSCDDDYDPNVSLSVQRRIDGAKDFTVELCNDLQRQVDECLGRIRWLETRVHELTGQHPTTTTLVIK